MAYGHRLSLFVGKRLRREQPIPANDPHSDDLDDGYPIAL